MQNSSFQPPEIRANVAAAAPAKLGIKLGLLIVVVSALTSFLVAYFFEKYRGKIKDYLNKPSVPKKIPIEPIIEKKETETDEIIGPPITVEKMRAFTGLDDTQKYIFLNTDQIDLDSEES